ncbi:MAG TPA: RNA polymerase sigma factor [Opitutaceae bacterium]|nr:RNA polymerase sigma factor [Opitutaceae bacterium]
MQEDAELLSRYVRTRDEAAFAELVHRHLNQVHAAALRRVGYDTHLAADVSQRVFIALAQQARWLLHHPTLAGWLHTTTRHQAANAVRAEQRRKARESEAHNMYQKTGTLPIEDIDWKIAGPAMEAALDQLNERDRRAVLMRFAEGKSFAATGSSLELSEDAARMRVDRALHKVRSHLASRGIVSTAALLGSALASQAAVQAPVHLAKAIHQAALNTASVLVPSTATIIQFMTTTKLAANLTAAALIILATGTATLETRAALRSKASLESLTAETSELTESLAQLDATARTKAAELAEQKRNAAAHESEKLDRETAAKIRSASSATAAALDPIQAGKAFLQRHPEAKAAFEKFVHGQVAAQYEPLWKALQLSPAEIEEFQRLVARNFSVGMPLGSDRSYAAFTLNPDLTQQQSGTQLQTLLGPDRFKEFLAYSDTLPARGLVNTLAGSLTFTNDPLTLEQVDRMIALITANQGRARERGPRPINWSPIQTAAKEFLNPTQLTYLNRLEIDAKSNEAMSLASVQLPK